MDETLAVNSDDEICVGLESTKLNGRMQTIHAAVISNQGQSKGLQLIDHTGIKYRACAMLGDEEDERSVDDEFRRVDEGFQSSIS